MKQFYKAVMIAFAAIILTATFTACTSTEEPDEESVTADLIGYWVSNDGLSEICFRDNGTGYAKEINDEGDVDRTNFYYEATVSSATRLTVVIKWRNSTPPSTLAAAVTASTLTLTPGKTYTRKPQ